MSCRWPGGREGSGQVSDRREGGNRRAVTVSLSPRTLRRAGHSCPTRAVGLRRSYEMPAQSTGVGHVSRAIGLWRPWGWVAPQGWEAMETGSAAGLCEPWGWVALPV